MNPPAQYREYLPAGPLRPFVECIWTRHPSVPNSHCETHRVLPDGCIDIVLDLTPGAPPRDRAGVIGTMTRPLEVSGNRSKFIGVRFRPGKARLFLDFRAGELTDASAPLGQIWGHSAAELFERAHAARTSAEAVRRVEAALLRMLPQRTGEPRVDRTVSAILEAQGAVSVESLAEDCGISRQHLKNCFADWVGTSPKFFARVIRFRYLLSLLGERRPIRWADLALEAGYFDQAHLIADFREFASVTPEAFLRNRLSTQMDP